MIIHSIWGHFVGGLRAQRHCMPCAHPVPVHSPVFTLIIVTTEWSQ